MSLLEKIKPNGPKRILALDGGGIRGILAVEILAKIEELLREKTGSRKEFVLADYFDFFCRNQHRRDHCRVPFLGHDRR